MAIDKSKDTLRGLLVMDPRITSDLWAAESTVTQAGPQPGTPEAQGNYDLVLSSSGTQAASKALRVQALEGGHPEPNGGGFVWQEDGDTAWRGHDVPAVITAWEDVVWTDGTGAIGYTRDPHAVTLADGTVIAAYQDRDLIGSKTRVVARTRNASTGAWSSIVAIHEQTLAPTVADFHPCLVVLPDERILLFHWIEDTTNEVAQIRMHFSTDSGATWTLGGSHVLKDDVSIAASSGGWKPTRIRGAYADGQIVLIAQTQSNNTSLDPRELWHQWASSSAGTRFDLIETGSGTDIWLGGHDVVVTGGKFGLIHIGGTNAEATVVFRGLASAYAKVSTADQIAIDSANNYATHSGAVYTDAGDLAAVEDDGGTLWVFGRITGGSGAECVSHLSYDAGDTWSGVGDSNAFAELGQWWTSYLTTTYPTNFAVTWQAGRVILLHNWEAPTANEDDSLGAMYLGGYSTLTMPGLTLFKQAEDRVGWLRNWLPFETPDNAGWTATGAGTSTLGSGAMTITTSGNTRYFNVAPPITSTPAEGAIATGTVKLTSGGSLANDSCSLRLKLEDGSAGYEVAVRCDFSPAKIRFADINAGAAIGSDYTVVSAWAEPVQFIVAMDDGNASLWVRQFSTDADREWTLAASSTGLTSSGGGGSDNIQFGHGTSGSTGSEWTGVQFVNDTFTGQGLATGQTNPDDLFPRAFAGPGYAQWVDGGTRITAHDGPARSGDTWHIDTRYDFPIERVFPAESPTPRVAWRSTGVTEETIALPLDATLLGTDESNPLVDTIGIALLNINFRLAYLEGYDDGTSAWVNLASIDAAKHLGGLSYDRQGNTIIPSSSNASTDEPYLALNECAGGVFEFSTGNVRRIKTNSAGLWTDGAASKPRLVLEDITGGEATTGTTVADIWMPNVCVLVNLLGATYAGYRLRIAAGTNVDGYFQIGSLIVGPVVYFGTQYSWGRSTETAANVDLVEQLDGVTRAKVLGPAARIVEFAWTDGIDTSNVSGNGPTGNYIKATDSVGGLPVATHQDPPSLIDGLVGMLDGPATPVVYLPRVNKDTDLTHLTHRDSFVAIRLTSPARVESIHGEERDQSVGEVVRVATITGRELI